MNKQVKSVIALTCACAASSIPVLVPSNTTTDEQASVIEVMADNDAIQKATDVRFDGLEDTPNYANIIMVNEKIADISQKYTDTETGQYVKVKNVSVFAEDNNQSAVIKNLQYGEFVSIVGDDIYNKDGWYKVLISDSEIGFVKKNSLTDKILFKKTEGKKFIKEDTRAFKDHNMKKKGLSLHQNEIIDVIGMNDELDLYVIKTKNGTKGYIRKGDTSEDMVFIDKEDVKYSKRDNNPVYSSYDKDSSVIKTFNKYNGIRILGYAKDWVKVRVDVDTEGYMKITALTEKCPQVKKAVSYAYSLLGTPYVWGGQTPDGTDCSGMTLQCYAHAGITIPRTAATQYYCGARLKFEDAKPGDLLIWAGHNDGRITHVGMYVGNDIMIHASSTYHQVVETSASAYMTHSQLMGVIRVGG